MNVSQIKQQMLSMTQSELSQIIHAANQIKSISADATFAVGQKVMVVQKTKQSYATIVKMNGKKAIVSMKWKGEVADVSVPYSMLQAA